MYILEFVYNQQARFIGKTDRVNKLSVTRMISIASESVDVLRYRY